MPWLNIQLMQQLKVELKNEKSIFNEHNSSYTNRVFFLSQTACNLKPEKPECQTTTVKIEGAHGWTPTMYIRLVQDFGLEVEVAQHLAKSYGDRAFAVAKLATLTGKRWPIIGNRIHPEFPYIDAEIRYGIREYACNIVDMIARRIRLSFLNVQAAQEALPFIADIMGEELKWSKEEKEVNFLQ